ncbi:MAG: metallophosphoesterase [Pseudotabrizicola sp.]|uniref:metallophosphoesterase family protein n=1 Tax=Pseudotabrizicola sp. TaxID=2939647 RepID=UPI00271CC79F|nr:metallophosphoesterase [Pseudotabrizicola sp.]MDO9640736.1 metallophosphoesterase [Pseudotabrizicola sp.]
MHRFAVMADPHHHALFPGYAVDGVTFQGRSGACLRPRQDSAESTRIFNESALVLPAVLDHCAAQGIRTVIIPGDLTDDGQAPSMQAALALLAGYSARHGMRFFLTPGNHDAYGMSGRHHAKDFLTAQGGCVTVSSQPDAQHSGDPAIVYDPRMACQGYGGLIEQWRSHGLMRDPRDLHWESPFGPDDAAAARVFDMTSPDGSTLHRQIDASYLVEPEPGLWLLSIDANVFEPRNGRPDNTSEDAFEDSTNAGWNALIRLKPFLLDWMADVARRAAAGNKTLICFSHYPVVDVLRGTLDGERALFGATSYAKRNPAPATSARIAATGIGTHFSGHLHFSGTSHATAEGAALTNIAVPSPVAFPPAFLLVSATQNSVNATTRMIDCAGFDAFFPWYGAKAGPSDWLSATSYPEFLYLHIRELVLHRFLPRDWPEDLRSFLQGRSSGDLLALAQQARPAFATDPDLPTGTPGVPVLDLLTDWYAARSAGPLAKDFVSADRLAAYAALTAGFDAKRWPDPTCLQARLAILMDMFAKMRADPAPVPPQPPEPHEY